MKAMTHTKHWQMAQEHQEFIFLSGVFGSLLIIRPQD